MKADENRFKRLILETKVRRYGDGFSARVFVKFECGHVYRFPLNRNIFAVGKKVNCPDCRELAKRNA